MANAHPPFDRLTGTESRPAAFLVYALYALSIVAVAIIGALGAALAILGAVIAYGARSEADPLTRSHLEEQIRLFWAIAPWGVGLFIVQLLAMLLTLILIGYPLLWLTQIAGYVVLAWLAVKSVLAGARLWNGAA